MFRTFYSHTTQLSFLLPSKALSYRNRCLTQTLFECFFCLSCTAAKYLFSPLKTWPLDVIGREHEGASSLLRTWARQAVSWARRAALWARPLWPALPFLASAYHPDDPNRISNWVVEPVPSFGVFLRSFSLGLDRRRITNLTIEYRDMDRNMFLLFSSDLWCILQDECWMDCSCVQTTISCT